jgi:hypothetical protein
MNEISFLSAQNLLYHSCRCSTNSGSLQVAQYLSMTVQPSWGNSFTVVGTFPQWTHGRTTGGRSLIAKAKADLAGLFPQISTMVTEDSIKNLVLFAAANLIAAIVYDAIVKPYLARRGQIATQ